jgi:hypothetical protein
MAGAMAGLLLTGRLLSLAPFVLVPQVAAVGLMIWARITFGRRSFHVLANPTVVVASVPVREGVDCAAVGNELPVHSTLAHLLLERRDLPGLREAPGARLEVEAPGRAGRCSRVVGSPPGGFTESSGFNHC